MNKYLLALLFLPLLMFGQTITENYVKTTNYNIPYQGQRNFPSTLFSGINCPGSFSGVLGGQITISNNLLSLNFSGSWTASCRMRLGQIVTINTMPPMPDIALGAITQIGGQETGYFAKIKNGALVFYSPYYLVGVNTTLTVPYNSTLNYSSAIGSLHNCITGGTGASGGNINITNTQVSLTLGGGWSNLCNIKTGPIFNLNLSPAITSLEMGPITTELGEETVYRARITNNVVEIYSTVPVPTPVTAVNTQFSYDLGVGDNYTQSIIYIDGLGRPKQNIAVKSGGNGQDVITPIVYDSFGREIKKYLPYADPSQTVSSPNYRDNNIMISTTLPNQYLQKFPGDLTASAPNPYSETFFEDSPLDMIRKKSAPGNSWVGNSTNENDHTIKNAYLANSASEVRKFSAVANWDINSKIYMPTLVLNGSYEVNQLYKTVTQDENKASAIYTGTAVSGKVNTVEEYKNKEGQIVLKRTFNTISIDLGDGTFSLSYQTLDTYYVYDQFGNLAYVLPPMVNTAATITNVSTTDLDNLCYQYKYDLRNRLVEKKMPGKGWEFIIYDKLDRQILTQDKELRDLGKWLFTKYDKFGRVAYTGKFSNTSNRTALQNAADAFTVFSVTPTTNVNFTLTTLGVYYTNDTYPNTNIELLSVNYYDDYRFVNASLLPMSVYEVNVSTNAKSLATGSVVRVLDTNKWITNFTSYDNKGRAIYQYTNDTYLVYHANTKIKIEEMTGLVLEKTLTSNQYVTTSQGLGYYTPVSIIDYYSYDTNNRLVTHTQKNASTGPLELITYNKYDELGQLEQKKIGGYYNPNDNYGQICGLQTVDYGRNIRGWLTSINQPDHDYPYYYTSLFTLGIGYNTGTVPQYNGNISGLLCKTPNDASPRGRGYDYFYDNLNRLVDTYNYLLARARVLQPYNESIKYDKNGNITSLKRGGWLLGGATSTTIDQLAYSYTGNKVDNVLDTGTTTESFIDGNNVSITGIKDYWYDDNGNITRDLNKGIGTATTDGITYNHLNLPVRIIFPGNNFIDYIYDATGKKLEKRVTQMINGSTILTTTQYHGQLVYQRLPLDLNAQLQFLPHDEGYLTKSNGKFDYVYQYKDHLNNVRVNYKEVVQSSSSYNFDTSYGGFVLKGGASYILQGGAIVVTATQQLAGLRKNITNTATPGQRFKFNFTVDRGTTGSARIFVSEANASTGLWTEYVVGYLKPGQQTFAFDYVVKEEAIINLSIDKLDTNNETTTFKLLDLVVNNVIVNPIEENNYYPFGLNHKGYGPPVNALGNSVAQEYKYNNKELQEELGLNLYDYGARNYDPAVGRWMSIDPLAEKYYPVSSFVYAINNPVYFVDPDGNEIKIGGIVYGFQKNRDYTQYKPGFERDTYIALDYLYSSGAMNVSFDGGATTVNVLDELINDKKNTLTIEEGVKGNLHKFLENKNDKTDGKVLFKGNSGTAFVKDINAPYVASNIGYNSPAGNLAHELLHGYSFFNDKNYQTRVNKKLPNGVITYDDGSGQKPMDFSYPNAEEQYNTTLTNQVLNKLKEDVRTNYGILQPTKTSSPTSMQ